MITDLSKVVDALVLAYVDSSLVSSETIRTYEEEKIKDLNTITYKYGDNHKVDRVWKDGKKSHYCKHRNDKGQFCNGLGDRSDWMPYHCDLFPKAEGKWILVHEGEKATDYALSKGIISTCIVGSGFKDKAIIGNLIDEAKKHQIQGFVYIADNDNRGIKKAKYIQDFCREKDYPCLIVPIQEVFKEAQSKDDIADWIIKYSGISNAKFMVDIEDYITEHHYSLIDGYNGIISEAKSTVTVDNSTQTSRLSAMQKVTEILTHDYSDRLKFNELKRMVELDGEQAYLDDFYLTLYEEYQIEIQKQKAFDMAVRFAKKNSYHPVREYLSNLSKSTVTVDITKLSTTFFGTNEPIYDEMVYRALIGSVARIFKPGCKLDTALVLQGSQGIGKSTFFKYLYGEEFFTESVHDTDKDNLMVMHQHWCCELAELDYITSKKEVGKLKAFLSCATDIFREPYGRSAMAYKRQSIFVGSCNKSDFLVDETGNRRFWIIPVEQDIDLEQLLLLKDSIWYEAVKAYEAEESWYLSREYQKQSEELNKGYMHQDSWDSQGLDSYLYGFEKLGISVRDILVVHLEIEEKDITKSHEMRMSRILTTRGWGNKRISRNGKRQVLWFKPDATPKTTPCHTSKNEVCHPKTLTQRGQVTSTTPTTQNPLSLQTNASNSSTIQSVNNNKLYIYRKGMAGMVGVANTDEKYISECHTLKSEVWQEDKGVALNQKIHDLAVQLNYCEEKLNSLTADYFNIVTWRDCSDVQKQQLIGELKYRLKTKP